MDKVYVVLSAYCGDPLTVFSVYKNRQDAEDYCKKRNDYDMNQYEDFIVSEYELN